jgi:hypothetical protein
MRGLFVLAVLLSGILLASTANAGVPDTPTPTPTPFPPGSSTVSVRFVLDGQPVEVFLLAPIEDLQADGVSCPVPIPQLAAFYPGYSTLWPLGIIGGPPACSGGPPTEITIFFRSPVVVFSATIPWRGQTVSVDLEIPEILALTATPVPDSPTPSNASPSPQPTTTPVSLPFAGGQIEHRTPPTAYFGVTVMAAMFVLFASFAAARPKDH